MVSLFSRNIDYFSKSCTHEKKFHLMGVSGCKDQVTSAIHFIPDWMVLPMKFLFSYGAYEPVNENVIWCFAENSSSRVRTVQGVSEAGLPHGGADCRQTKLP